MITRNEANLIDSPFSFTSSDTVIEKSFDVQEKQIRNIPYTNMFWNTVTFEISQTRIKLRRTVYSISDFLSELGGLFGAIMPVFTFFVTVFQYRGTFMSLTSAMMAKPKQIDE